MINGKTKVYGIFGHPVEHTFSPAMHNAAFARLGMSACYVPFDVPPGGLKKAVSAILPLGIHGLNVTVPHKEKIIPFLDGLSREARLIGAVNTIEVTSKGLIGHNTDGRGFLRSLREQTSFKPKGKDILLIGSGGAARAVGFSLALGGVKHLLLCDIETAKARRLGAAIRSATGTAVKIISLPELRKAAPEADCIINATPVGLKRTDQPPVPATLLRRGQLVCDLVYNPPRTRLLAAAQQRGAKTLSGLGMLLFQGVIAFEIWTGTSAPVEIMRKALLRQIRLR